jgi:hypothetical protein
MESSSSSSSSLISFNCGGKLFCISKNRLRGGMLEKLVEFPGSPKDAQGNFLITDHTAEEFDEVLNHYRTSIIDYKPEIVDYHCLNTLQTIKSKWNKQVSLRDSVVDVVFYQLISAMIEKFSIASQISFVFITNSPGGYGCELFVTSNNHIDPEKFQFNKNKKGELANIHNSLKMIIPRDHDDKLELPDDDKTNHPFVVTFLQFLTKNEIKYTYWKENMNPDIIELIYFHHVIHINNS